MKKIPDGGNCYATTPGNKMIPCPYWQKDRCGFIRTQLTESDEISLADMTKICGVNEEVDRV